MNFHVINIPVDIYVLVIWYRQYNKPGENEDYILIGE